MTLSLQDLVKEVITHLWHAPILRVLSAGPTRYADIRSKLIDSRGYSPGDGHVNAELRELRSLKLIEQRQLPDSRRRAWALTELGGTVVGLVNEIDDLTDPDKARIDADDHVPADESTATVGRRDAHTPWLGMSMEELQARASVIDPTTPHPARRYDYLLGGKTNFQVDRESALEIEAVMPTVRLAAMENRGFLRRAVSFLSRRGVRQFLDIGTGIPTSPNTHEIAQAIDPTARVVYVDNDPIVGNHARALLTGTPEGTTVFIDADLREPGTIVANEQLLSTLDLSQPVGLLLIAVLHFIRDDENPKGIIATLVDALPTGSWVVVSHTTFEFFPTEKLPQLAAPNRDGRFNPRSGEEMADLLDGLELLDPGIQSVAQWWAEMAPEPRPRIEDVAMNGAVARILR